MPRGKSAPGARRGDYARWAEQYAHAGRRGTRPGVDALRKQGEPPAPSEKPGSATSLRTRRMGMTVKRSHPECPRLHCPPLEINVMIRRRVSSLLVLCIASRVPARSLQLARPEDYAAPDRSRPIRVGIVMLTKNPVDILGWLEHHRRLGVHRVYVRVEDGPDVVRVLTRPEYADVVYVDSADGENDYMSPLYFKTMERQTRWVDEAISRARADGVTHLLHIDDDELLYCPLGRATLDAELSNIQASSIHLDNAEAVYDESNCFSPFATTRHFCIDQANFTAYANGKSFGNLQDESLKSWGVHRFWGDEYHLPPHVAVILHYEGSCLVRWAEKFAGYARTMPDACQEIPFAYYCDSIQAFSDPTLTTHDRTRVWERWKLLQSRQDDGVVMLEVQ